MQILKEQNAIIEDKITRAQIVKDDTTIDKYDINEVISFLKTRMADLGETYKRSNLAQIKVLLGSIFLSGLAWNYNGTLNHRISPLYQAILGLTEQNVRSSADERS